MRCIILKAWHRLWIPPLAPISILSWLFAMAATGFATLMYWLSPDQELFEHWFDLPPAPVLVNAWWSSINTICNTYPDFAWSLLIGCGVRDLIWGLQWRLPSLLVLCAATSWELGQLFYFLPGHFDSVDLALSVAGGVIALFLPNHGETP